MRERYDERFTITPCSEKLVTTHNVSPRVREDLGPSLLHVSAAELPMHGTREKGDYSRKNLEMGTVYISELDQKLHTYLAWRQEKDVCTGWSQCSVLVNTSASDAERGLH